MNICVERSVHENGVPFDAERMQAIKAWHSRENVPAVKRTNCRT
jgi:hypothetical protein